MQKNIDRGAADEISVSKILFWQYLEYVHLILHNLKKLKRTTIVIFTISSFLSLQYFSVTTAE